LDRTLMATKWNESLQYTWESKGVGKCLWETTERGRWNFGKSLR
jgi:hypothetical protein